MGTSNESLAVTFRKVSEHEFRLDNRFVRHYFFAMYPLFVYLLDCLLIFLLCLDIGMGLHTKSDVIVLCYNLNFDVQISRVSNKVYTHSADDNIFLYLSILLARLSVFKFLSLPVSLCLCVCVRLSVSVCLRVGLSAFLPLCLQRSVHQIFIPQKKQQRENSGMLIAFHVSILPTF